ncbi:non-structural maintenance of chromosomes element 1 homolog [Selaginella moellendorffii]|uniref:non-structural maintenance of chromosomes element 1 homolog n=1 Tax=Selaginella moellendorffii TaxID=88036 RepID=UPI000D1C9493|nr:non-structural maintenance of chromosomes element 1 homolog [Selaginella moellendorffii]XP_024542589.1 non-structural maintenance of chromosomes element 1 homolog [Selaginella moellendorffii]|eukprot:XP_024542587.1 non-structural maintenance of chromosomes element 1 homolog [Selaginella moellendorffii]
MALDSRHHAFIQSLLARGPQPAVDCKKMFQKLFDARPGEVEENFFDFLKVYNKHLDFFQLEIRGSTNQHDGTQYYGVVNKLASEPAKLATQYSAAQIAYFKALVEAIVQEPSGELSSIDALNLREDQTRDSQEASSSQSVSLPKLSLAQRDKVLGDLAADKWLYRTEDGGVSLGIKSFLELRSVFMNLEVPFCDVCNEAAIKAMRCQNEDCSARMHSYCAKTKFQRPEIPRSCASCGSEWDCEGLDLNEDIQPEPAENEQRTRRRRRARG